MFPPSSGGAGVYCPRGLADKGCANPGRTGSRSYLLASGEQLTASTRGGGAIFWPSMYKGIRVCVTPQLASFLMRSFLNRVAFTFAFLCFIGFSAFAQQLSISGTVQD